MNKVDMIINTKHMYTLEGDGVGYREDQAIVVDGGRIKAVAPKEEVAKEYTAEKVIDATDKLVLPGFIDGHMHTCHAVLRGLAQDLEYWMMDGIAPFDAVRSYDAKAAGSRMAIAEAVMNGTTTIGDDGNDVEPVCAFIDKIGVRGNISVRIRDAVNRRYLPGELYEYKKELADKNMVEFMDLYQKYNNKDNERIKIRFGPQGPDFCSKESLLELRQKAEELDTKIHMHLQQGSREAKQMMMRYGMRGARFLESIGYLDDRLVGIHLTDSSTEELQLLAKYHVNAVYCPGSIGIIDGIIAPGSEYRQLGGNVALGSDQSAGNNCHNIINEMKLCSLFGKIKNGNGVDQPAWESLRMATIEGAKALGIDHLTGSIEAGKSADIILVNLNDPAMRPIYTQPMRNFIPNLVYAAQGSIVDTVIAAGNLVMENRKPLTFNLEEVVEEAQKYADEIAVKGTPQFNEIHGANAVMMEKGQL